jgi:hypothetical protein
MPGEQNPKMPPQTISREQLKALLGSLMVAQPDQEPLPEDQDLEAQLAAQAEVEKARQMAEKKARMRQMLAPLPQGTQESIESTADSLDEMQRLMDEEEANRNR